MSDELRVSDAGAKLCPLYLIDTDVTGTSLNLSVINILRDLCHERGFYYVTCLLDVIITIAEFEVLLRRKPSKTWQLQLENSTFFHLR